MKPIKIKRQRSFVRNQSCPNSCIPCHSSSSIHTANESIHVILDGKEPSTFFQRVLTNLNKFSKRKPPSGKDKDRWRDKQGTLVMKSIADTELEKESTSPREDGGTRLSTFPLSPHEEETEAMVSESIIREEADKKCSTITVEKTIGAKMYLEQYFDELFEARAGRVKRRQDFELYLQNLKAPDSEKTRLRMIWLERERNYSRIVRGKIHPSQFELIRPLSLQHEVDSHGIQGEEKLLNVLWLVREKWFNMSYAMRKLDKRALVRKNLERRVRSERDFFHSAPVVSKYIVDMIYAFQCEDYLYFVMEYMPGGSLKSLLDGNTCFDEQAAKFYIAEMALCIHEVHQIGWAHRNIQPSQFLFDSEGHLKISGFGYATNFHWTHNTGYYLEKRHSIFKSLDKHDHIRSKRNSDEGINSSFESEAGDPHHPKYGTFAKMGASRDSSDNEVESTTHINAYDSPTRFNNYLAPELLMNLDHSFNCDWWSLGIIAYELLYGTTPFMAQTPNEAIQRVIHFQQYMRFPTFPHVSPEAQDLIQKLCSDPQHRLSTFEEVTSHPFFRGIDWVKISSPSTTVPFLPEHDPLHKQINRSTLNGSRNILSEKTSAQAFKRTSSTTSIEEQSLMSALEARKSVAFKGFTYKKFQPFEMASRRRSMFNFQNDISQ